MNHPFWRAKKIVGKGEGSTLILKSTQLRPSEEHNRGEMAVRWGGGNTLGGANTKTWEISGEVLFL